MIQLAEHPHDIADRRKGVDRKNVYAQAEIADQSGDEYDTRWAFWAGFVCGIIGTAIVFAVSFFIWVPR